MTKTRLLGPAFTSLVWLAVGCSASDVARDSEIAENGASNNTGNSSFSPSEDQDNSAVGGTGVDSPNAVSAQAPQGETVAVGGSAPGANDLAFAPGSPPFPEESVVDGEQEDDRFTSVGTNPFVMVAHDPLSTFATDVDTASYDLFRRQVEESSLPVPDSVRLEEYVNFFQYSYPSAEFEAAEPFRIDLAAGPSILNEETTILRVGIQGKDAPPTEKKLTNLVFLVDVSGSMRSSDKIDLVQQVMRQTLDLLQDGDTVSIVSYAGDTRVRLSPTDATDRETLEAAIAGLVTAGGTNGAGGINLAYEQAEAAYIEGGVNHVILCSDGDFNVGPSSDQELVDLIREKRKGGVTFTALGFGLSNLNDSMLEAVSNAGNGFYGVITGEEQAAEYVDKRMLSSLGLIAKDMKVQVEFNPELVAAYRLLGYENRDIADIDFRNNSVDAGEIGAGHQVTALYELVLSGEELPIAQDAPAPTDGAAFDGQGEVSTEDLVLVKVRYKDVDATEQDAAFEVAQAMAPDAIGTLSEQAVADLQWATSVAAFSEILKNSPYANADAEKLEALDAVFSAQSSADADRLKFYELFSAARELL